MAESSSTALSWLKLDKDEPSDIFYSCLGSIVASTLLALHLNADPSCSESTSRFVLKRFWDREIRHIRRQLCWAVMVVIAPELLVSLAFGDWRAASEGVTIFRDHGKGQVKEWTRTHASLVNMGGLRLTITRSKAQLPPALASSSYRSIWLVWRSILKHHAPLNRLSRLLQAFIGSVCQTVASMSLLRRVLGHIDKGKGIQNPDRSGSASVAAPGDAIELTQVPQEPGRSERRTSFSSNSAPPAILPVETPGESQAGPSRLEDLPRPTEERSSEPRSNLHLMESSATEYLRANDEIHQLRSSLPQVGDQETVDLYLNARQIVAAQMMHIIDDNLELSESDIRDREKANSLMKIAAIVPLLWFAARVSVKAHLGRAISQLELATSTYIICCILTYLLCWSKPQGIERPMDRRVTLDHGARPLTDQDMENLRKLGGSPFLSRNFVPPFGMDNHCVELTEPTPNGTSLTAAAAFGSVAFFDDDFAGTLAGMIIGGLYLPGWNANNFPSSLERIAWRGAIVAIMGSLIPYSIANGICTVSFRQLRGPGGRVRTHVLHSLVLYTLLGIYILARLYMLAGMVREFFV